jgi:transposase
MVKSSMNEIERKAVYDGPVVSEGGRGPSTLSAGPVGTVQAAARPGPLAPGQRWSYAGIPSSGGGRHLQMEARHR